MADQSQPTPSAQSHHPLPKSDCTTTIATPLHQRPCVLASTLSHFHQYPNAPSTNPGPHLPADLHSCQLLFHTGQGLGGQAAAGQKLPGSYRQVALHHEDPLNDRHVSGRPDTLGRGGATKKLAKGLDLYVTWVV